MARGMKKAGRLLIYAGTIMAESILNVSKVTLFGRVVEDIVPKPAGKKKFARVYGFSYGGLYFDLAGPTMFLVEGDGVAASKVKEPGPGLDDDDPFYMDLKAWTCEQNDTTVRLDYETGRFEQVLLGLVDEEMLAEVSGSRVAGSRVAGSRVSGSRVSGSRVAGSRVSGSRVSGSRVSGSRVSGSRVDGD